ncbi:MAG TPA: isochorismatase family protein [Hyphomicrobium sp.]|uniref:isochorismatase family protein n=1 Tax=Hyphomicrobium sp. TaxID=82 RepID=UPI002BBA5E62|nr:isochorismatase family protein [Hyphomicrobium sp.]HRN87394.1 isochorismatase family protein [Hyphomicrobium sp.]
MAPLLKPEECSLLFIDPVRRNIERSNIDDNSQYFLIGRYALFQQAARVLDVPEFFLIDGNPTSEQDWIVQPNERSRYRVHVASYAGSLWSTSGLGAALAKEDRACLVLCGFWLDGNITFVALNALADGFDVYVLMDACLTCDKQAQSPAVDRLLQAGVVPLTTMQMVREWAECTADETRRSLLLDLLTST